MPGPSGPPRPQGALDARAAADATVLVVDDNPLVRAATARLVALLGYPDVAVAADVPTAVAAARRLRALTLLVTDVHLVGADGVHLAAALAPRHPGLRVVFMSGHAWGAAEAARAAGLAHVFLRKPFTAGDLGAAIERVQSPQW